PLSGPKTRPASAHARPQGAALAPVRALATPCQTPHASSGFPQAFWLVRPAQDKSPGTGPRPPKHDAVGTDYAILSPGYRALGRGKWKGARKKGIHAAGYSLRNRRQRAGADRRVLRQRLRLASTEMGGPGL